MSDLLSLLSLGSTAISAQNEGVAVASNNVANANTVGYSRETATFNALTAPPTVGGVLAGDPQRVASDLLQGRIRLANSSLSYSQTTSSSLSDLETSLTSGPSITDKLTTVFANLDQVSGSPTDPNLRAAAVSSLQDLTSAIHSAASTVADAQTNNAQQIGDIATQATALANQLAAANKAVQQSNDPTAKDSRDQIAQQLTELVGGKARIDGDGYMRFVLDGGAVLVDGPHAASMNMVAGPAVGQVQVNVVDGQTTRDVTSTVTSGQLGGALAVHAQLGTIATQYDQYAYDLATGFNSVSTANAGLDGVSGRNTFTPPVAVAGAAAALAIDPGLAANPSQLATAAVGAGPGDNTGALALRALANQTVATGGTRTLSDASLDLATGLAHQVSTEKSNASADQLVASHLSDLRDSLSGVDLTEEQTNLSKFSNASAAMTKFVAAINDMLTNLITNL